MLMSRDTLATGEEKSGAGASRRVVGRFRTSGSSPTAAMENSQKSDARYDKAARGMRGLVGVADNCGRGGGMARRGGSGAGACRKMVRWVGRLFCLEKRSDRLCKVVGFFLGYPVPSIIDDRFLHRIGYRPQR